MVTLLSSLLFTFFATSEVTCPPDMREATAAITIGFGYTGGSSPLVTTTNDALFYHSRIGAAVSKSPKFISDADIKGRGKSAFLAMIKKQVAGKQFVSFNYAGHGNRYTKGRWAMILPGMPAEDEEKCQIFYERMSYGLPAGEDKEGCEKIYDKYTVTDEELRNIFKGKKVLAINDSCNSAKANLGSSVVHIPSALEDQPAFDKLSNNSKHGAMTGRIKEQFNQCEWDTNKDSRLDAEELTARYAVSRPGRQSKDLKAKSKRKTVSVFSQISLVSKDKENTEYYAKAADFNPYLEIPPDLAAAEPGKGTPRNFQQVMSLQNYQPWLKCFNFGAIQCPTKTSPPTTESEDIIQ